jgi:thiol-disulfide isomerase/thioredoxin
MSEGEARQEKLWTPGRIIATLVVAALIATMGYVLFAGGGAQEKESKTMLPGAAAAASAATNVPPDFDVPTLDGSKFKISEYSGKVVVLDFWATWCPPCRKEIPQLVRIANQHRDRGVEVIGLHLVDSRTPPPETIRKFIDDYSISYTVGMADENVFTAYLGREETAIPQTLVFGRDGRVVAHLIGYSEADARKLDEAVNRALAGS